MATKKTTKEADNVIVTESGLKIKLRGADPLFLNAMVNSVDFPDTPTYEAVTAHGNVEVHEMDEVAAEQTEGGKEIWEKYQRELAAAESKQNDISVRAILMLGTERPKKDYLDPEWIRKLKILRVPIPEDPDEAWVDYLNSTLSPADLVKLMAKVMRLTGGVEEEVIQEVEDSFRDSILPESGEDEVDDAE